MRKHILSAVAAFIGLLAYSGMVFGQTYGTKGYAPGAWPPDELPKDLAKAKPFDQYDLSGVWSMPTKRGYFERHSFNDKPIKIDPGTPPQMGSDTYPPLL